MSSTPAGAMTWCVCWRVWGAWALCGVLAATAHAQDEAPAPDAPASAAEVEPAETSDVTPSAQTPDPGDTPVPAADSRRAGSKARLYVEDGQLLSHPFWVFVTHHIEPEMKPQLRLLGGHVVTDESELETTLHTPPDVYPDQYQVMGDGDGPRPTVKGTLLRFKFASGSVRPFNAAVRLRPVLQWEEDRGDGQGRQLRYAVAEREIYLSNMVGGLLWMGVVLCVVLAALLSWSMLKSDQIEAFRPRGWLLLITGPDGYLSLWRTQLFLWTVAISALVFLFGLLRLKVPELPDSLVVLMGLSLATGGVSAGKAGKEARRKLDEMASTDQNERKRALHVNEGRAQWSDLISAWNPALHDVELSLPKAQMVLWTVVVLVLFVVKSLLSGELWNVPWTLVALTGISQTGYVSNKFLPDGARSAAKPVTSEAKEPSSSGPQARGGTAVPVHVE